MPKFQRSLLVNSLRKCTLGVIYCNFCVFYDCKNDNIPMKNWYVSYFLAQKKRCEYKIMRRFNRVPTINFEQKLVKIMFISVNPSVCFLSKERFDWVYTI